MPALEERNLVDAQPPCDLAPVALPVKSPEIGDLRFRTLVGEAAWAQLPEAVRRRFSKCLGP